MTKISLLSAFIAFSLLFNGCSKEKTNDETTSIDEANSILSSNEIILTALDKTQYTVLKKPNGFIVKGAENKVILLDIFATWCPPCRAEASHLSSLQKKFKDSLLVIGVSVEDAIENSKLQTFRETYNADYVLVNSYENGKIIDAVTTQLNLGRNFGIPLMALYKDGKLINFYQGAVEEEFLAADIKKALGK